MKYHLVARPNKEARNKIWYAWYWDPDGRRTWRSTGCRTKNEAYKIVRQWENEDEKHGRGSLRGLAAHYFVPGKCPYLHWRTLKEQTIDEHRRNLKKILSQYGDRVPATITAPEVEQWLEREYPDKSGSWKISVLTTFRIVLTELQRSGAVRQVPRFRQPQKASRRADALTREEVEKLFPADDLDLALIWTRPVPDRKDRYGLMFGIMFQVMLHSGMRPGEVRALRAEYIYPELCGIHIARQLDSAGRLTWLKKAGADDRRERLVKVPQGTMDRLTDWMRQQEITDGFVFLYEGVPVRAEYLQDRFDSGLTGAKIKPQGRRLIPYSLRYTYRSLVEGHLKQQQIMATMGHRSEQMSLHYLHIHPDQLQTLSVSQEQIEEIWQIPH